MRRPLLFLFVAGCGASDAPTQPVVESASPSSSAAIAPATQAAASSAPAPRPSAGVEPIRTEAKKALGDCSRGREYLAALKSASPTDLEILAKERGPASLQASWELHRKPAGKGLDGTGVLKFFARVGDRLGNLPMWWQTALKGATVHDNGVTSYSLMDTLVARYAHEVPWGKAKVRVPAGVVPGDIAREMVAPSMGDASHLEILRDKGSAFVVAFSAGSGGFPFEVHRVDGTRVVWKGTACSAGRQVLGGVGSLVVEMTKQNGELVVWSAESHGVAVDVFDAETGAVTLRFSSDLWMARQP